MLRPVLGLNIPSQFTADISLYIKNARARWIRDNSHIHFVGSDIRTFQLLDAALVEIELSETGLRLLDDIKLILGTKLEKLAIHLSSSSLGVIPHRANDVGNGLGTSSDFHCNFNVAENIKGEELETTKWHACIVFHELVHVLHNLKGKRMHTLWAEEAKTVGLGSFSNESISENVFRNEIGVPRRSSYSSGSALINDDDTVTLNGGGYKSVF
ncbi:M91 family zinc metallopeptidase [Xenorhabdus indica]|uniref:M91 family zinc metallopeptidase n=1 Tax=Xenorhabdus indica TaxID=333964 RepID=UPI001656F5A2|nr:M91 family zinc metallopeptidase [Xenorhabdus indica]MBC8943681.1 T3SS effector protein NleD [Xenorhabdus indica]